MGGKGSGKGGAREGAGRPAKGRTDNGVIYIRLPAKEKEYIQVKAAEANLTVAEFMLWAARTVNLPPSKLF